MTINLVSSDNGVLTLSSSISSEIVVIDAPSGLVELSASNISVVSSDLFLISTDSASFYGISWDDVGERVYETGIDRGVLYLPDGSGVPWNGLTSIVESFDQEVTPVYYDGMKINDLVALGDFSGVMTAITYPDEFIEFEGFGISDQGIIYGNQKVNTFALSYRTLIGNDVEGDKKGYKLHILYNVTATPSDKTYATLSADSTPSEFQWNIVAVPEEVPGFRPTAYIIIDSRKIDPLLLYNLERILYGNGVVPASLIPMADLVLYFSSWIAVKIVDNGDGTWSATDHNDGHIINISSTEFEIDNVDAVYLDADTFEVFDTA